MMRTKLTLLTTATLTLGLGLAAGSIARADHHADHDEHLKVIQETDDLKKAMKNFSKGVGVKCTACHVKKEWESEKKAMKDKSRAFFRATVGVTDQAQRDAALADLLKLLEREEARDAKLVWKGIDMMKRK